MLLSDCKGAAVHAHLNFGAVMTFGKLVAAAVGVSLALCAAPAASALSNEDYTGSIGLTAASFCPKGTVEPKGQVLQISQHSALFALFTTTYGGDGQRTFALPDLGDEAAPKGMRFCMVMNGVYPPKD